MISTSNYNSQPLFGRRPATRLMNSTGSGKVPEFEVHAIEWLNEHQPAEHYESREASGFEIIWIKQAPDCGSNVAANTMYILTPGKRRLLNALDGLKGYIISFSSDFLLMEDRHNDFFLELDTSCNSITMTLTEDKHTLFEMEDLIMMMMREYNNYFSLRSEVLKGFLKIFMIYLSRNFTINYTNTFANKDRGLTRKFLTMVRTNFVEMKMVADYAKALYVTPSYLNQVIKRISGFTARHHIQECIINQAKQKATYSELSMKEIAYSLGFKDHCHFSKFFKNASGMNFTSFKKTDMSTGA